MSLSAKLETATFERQMRQLARATQRSEQAVLDEQGRLLVRDCIVLTPPFTPGRNFIDSYAAQRRVGQAVTRKHVEGAFKNVRDLEMFKAESRMGVSLRRLVRQGKLEEAGQLLQKAGIRTKGLRTDATPDAHRTQRDRRGRVNLKKGGYYTVTNGRSIAALVRRKLQHVGIAKGGWAKAALALGLKLPGWISSQSRSGVFVRGRDPQKPYIVISNVVPYIQSTGAELRIIERALTNRRRNMPKQLEAAVRAQARKARLQVS